MFGSRTKVEDVVKWRRANRVDSIVRALSDRDPAVRAAAAGALEQVDTSEAHTKPTTLEAASAALVARLDEEPDAQVLASVARALGNLGIYSREDGDRTTWYARPEVIRALITTMNRTADPETRAAAGRAIERILLVKDSNERIKACLVVFPMLAYGQGLTPESSEDLLRILASVYIWTFKSRDLQTTSEWEESRLGRAFDACGPKAGRALVEVGTKLQDANAVAFGTRIVEGTPRPRV